MENVKDAYRDIPVYYFNGIGDFNLITSNLYKTIDNAFKQVEYSQFKKIIDWKNYDSIKKRNTRFLFEIATADEPDPQTKNDIYMEFIVIFLAKYIFCNNLILNIDAIRLFQSDFLGWKMDEIS